MENDFRQNIHPYTSSTLSKGSGGRKAGPYATTFESFGNYTLSNDFSELKFSKTSQITQKMNNF